VALALVVGAAFAVDRLHGDRLAPGLRIAGVPVGGLSPREAERRLRRTLLPELARPVVVRYRSRTFELDRRRAGLRVEVDAMVKRALARSKRGSFLGRAVRYLAGGGGGGDVALETHLAPGALDRFVVGVATAIDRPAVDARIDYAARGITPIRGHEGSELDARLLAKDLAAALGEPAFRAREIVPKVTPVAPSVTLASLARRYPRIIIVDRRDFRLRLYRNLRLAHTYRIAVGRAGLETPAGLHVVQDKQVNPSWYVPHSAWAGSLAGRVIAPGPQDPLKARWMAIDDRGDGIHGTDELGSLGSAASHGCIRMSIPDVIALYDQVQLGTPVYVA
jgi:lipoprotein-anchoring transpeptidase ErfK/SrfK